MKYIFALLLMLAAPAWAQAPPCYPLINGVHVGTPRHLSTDLGEHLYWGCSARGGEPKVYGWSCLKGQCSRAALAAAQANIVAATAKLSTAQSMYASGMTFECEDVMKEDTPRGALCRERAAALRTFGPSWFPKEVK